MTDKEFDKFISSKLNHMETPVSANLWDKIAADTQKRRRILPWWQTTAYLYPIAAAAILAVAIATFWLSGHSSVLPPKASNTAKETPNQLNLPKTPIHSNNTINPPVPNEAAHNNTPQIIDSTSTHSPAISNNVDAIERSNATTTTIQKTSKKKTKNLFSSSTKNKYPLVDLTENKRSSLKDALSNQPLLVPQTDVVAIAETKENWLALNKGNIVNRTIQLSSQTLPSVLTHRSNAFQNPLACPQIKRQNIFIDFFASPNIANQQIRSNGASQAYILLKDSSERMQMGFTIGGRITKSIGHNWFVSAGIQYTQNNQQFIQKTENERKTTVVLVTRSITNELGVTTTFLDTTTITEVGYRTKTFINQYKNIEIPIIANYNMGNSNWQFGLHAGTVLGISNQYVGYTYDKNGNSISFNNSNNPIFRSQLQVGLIGGFGIYRKINYQTSVFAEPHFRYALTSYQSTALNFNQKIQLTGITAGIRFQLNNLSKSSISLQ